MRTSDTINLIPNADLSARLHRAAQIIDARYNRSLSDIGLTDRQVLALRVLKGAGGLTQTEIVRLSGLDRSTLSVMLQSMADRQLVEIVRSKADGRANVVKLTSHGVGKLRAAERRISRIDAEIAEEIATQPKKKAQRFQQMLDGINSLIGCHSA